MIEVEFFFYYFLLNGRLLIGFCEKFSCLLVIWGKLLRVLGLIKLIKDLVFCFVRGFIIFFVGIGIWCLYSLFSVWIIECLVIELVVNLCCNGLVKVCKLIIDFILSLFFIKLCRFFVGLYFIEVERNN